MLKSISDGTEQDNEERVKNGMTVLYIRTKVIEIVDKRMKITVKRALEAAIPRLFGQACLAIQRAMRNLAKTKQLLEGREDFRLMDAAVVIIGGLEGELGLRDGAVLDFLRRQRKDAFAHALGDEFGEVLRAFVAEKRLMRGEVYSGYTIDFHKELTALARAADLSDSKFAPKWMPSTERVLSERMRRSQGALRASGLFVKFAQHPKNRRAIITLHFEDQTTAEDAIKEMEGYIDQSQLALPTTPARPDAGTSDQGEGEELRYDRETNPFHA